MILCFNAYPSFIMIYLWCFYGFAGSELFA